MTYKFDQQKYKSIFNKMYGKGAFDSGISQASQIGALKGQAEAAKTLYNARKQAEKAVAEANKYNNIFPNTPVNTEAAKQIDDMIANPKKKGAFRNADDIKNDPALQQEIKNRGYNVNDFIDAMYNAASGGQFKSSRQFSQYEKKLNSDNAPYRKDNQDSIQSVIDADKAKAQAKTTTTSHKQVNKSASKSNKRIGNPLLDALSLRTPLSWLDKNVVQPIEKNVTDRFATEAANQLALGQLKKNIDKMPADMTPQFVKDAAKPAKNKVQKAADIAGGLYGAAIPIGGAYKVTKPAAEEALKILTLGKDLGRAGKLANDAVRGATAMGTYSTAAEGIDALLHPNDATMQQRAKNIALNTALGAVGDPAFRLAGTAIKAGASKGLDAGLKKLLPEDLPKFNGKASNDVLDRLTPSKKENLQKQNLLQPLNVDSLSKVKRYSNPDQAVNEFLGKTQKSDSPLTKLAKKTMYEERKMPDFSTAKPVIEQPSNVNVYGVEVPKDDLIDTAPPEYWQKRYEDFVQYVKDQGYTENNLSLEAINELWSHFAKPNEPALNAVIDRAYNGYQEPKALNASDVWNQLGNRPAVSNNAKKIMGITDLNQVEAPKLSNQDLLQPLSFNKTGQQDISQLLLPKLNPKQSDSPNLLQQLTPEQVNSGRIPKLQDVLPKLTESPSNGLKDRGHIETLRNSQNSTESLKERIKGMYKPTTNEEALTIANKYLAQGVDKAISFVKSARVLKPEHIATAHRLIQELQKSGQIEKAVDVAEHIATQGTKAGQAVQAFSIFDRLSPEGILVHANRVADRVNAKLSPLQRKVTVSNDMANQLTDLATTVQKMTQQKTVANDVINIMDKAKAGQKLTDEETRQIHQFVSDAKQFIGDITPKKNSLPKLPPKLINPEVKKQIVSFLDKQEEAARKRLAQRKGRALSGLPVDDFYDYAVIGASKLVKGTLNLADFSEQMIREFGQEVAPYVKEIYDKASEMVFNEVKRTTHRMSEVEKITNKALKNGKLEPDEAENLRKFALSINTMSGDAKIEASQELQGVLQGLERPTLLQQISTAQTIGQLLNPKTLTRNAIGNEMFYRLERLNKLVATPIDIARSKITGGERTVTFRTNNQAEYWKNWLRGAKAGARGVNPEGLTTQYDLQPNSFNGKRNPMTYLERALGATLKSFDYAGYKRAVNNTIGELATLRAVNEGLTGQEKKQAIERYIREADDNVLAIADQYGKYATFQDNNVLAVGLQKFKKGLNFGKDFGIGDLVLKYPKTPGALLGRALEYSPAGFLKAAYQIAKPIFTKGSSSSVRDITESLTRALIGTGGAFGIAWFLADKGVLTGKGNQDFDVNDLEESAGKAEYALNIDALKRWVFSGFNSNAAETQRGDHFISYNWAQPIAMSVAMGANAKQNEKANGNPSWGGASLDAANGALDSLAGMSVLSGIQRAFTSYPGQSVGDQLMNIAGQLPASFIPTLSNQIRQKSDNTARSTYDPLKTNVYKNQSINKVPGLASQLPISYDTLGRKKEVYQDKSNTLFNVFLNPSFVSRYNPSSEAKMVLDVINDTGDSSVAPRRAQKYLMIDGKKYDLSPQQYSEYQHRLGTAVRTQLQGLNPKLPAEQLGEKISKILDATGRKVRNELKREFFSYSSKN